MTRCPRCAWGATWSLCICGVDRDAPPLGAEEQAALDRARASYVAYQWNRELDRYYAGGGVPYGEGS